MTKQKRHSFARIIAFVLAMAVTLSICPTIAFAETITQGPWTIENGTGSGTATLSGMKLTYYSPSSTITYGNSYGKDFVRSNSTNGSASNGIVVTSGKSYCEYIPEKNGTLKFYVGNAATKTGYVSKTDANNASTAIGSFVPGGSDNYDKTGFKVIQGDKIATLEIEVEVGNKYYITLSGSKMFCYGAEFTAYTVVSGTVNDSFSIPAYGLKFVNNDTKEVFNADVADGKYSIELKPNFTYTVSLTGDYIANYGISSDTKSLTVEQKATQTADFTTVERSTYKVDGNLTGIDSGYSSKDIALVFVPDDTSSYEEVEATLDFENKKYEALLLADVNYTLNLKGAADYALAESYKFSGKTAVTKDINFKAVTKYAVSGKFIGLTDVRGEYKDLSVTPTAITFENVADGYVYTGTPSEGTYTASLRNGSYLASITADGYSTSTHVTVKDGAVTRNLLLKEAPKTVSYRDTLYVGADK